MCSRAGLRQRGNYLDATFRAAAKYKSRRGRAALACVLPTARVALTIANSHSLVVRRQKWPAIVSPAIRNVRRDFVASKPPFLSLSLYHPLRLCSPSSPRSREMRRCFSPPWPRIHFHGVLPPSLPSCPPPSRRAHSEARAENNGARCYTSFGRFRTVFTSPLPEKSVLEVQSKLRARGSKSVFASVGERDSRSSPRGRCSPTRRSRARRSVVSREPRFSFPLFSFFPPSLSFLFASRIRIVTARVYVWAITRIITGAGGREICASNGGRARESRARSIFGHGRRGRSTSRGRRRSPPSR